jgi:hypothetical protein
MLRDLLTQKCVQKKETVLERIQSKKETFQKKSKNSIFANLGHILLIKNHVLKKVGTA